MSFFKKMLSSVGIGSAKVDTVLHHHQFVPGDFMDATVYLRGGKMDQEVNDIYFRIYCDYVGHYMGSDDETRKHALLVEHKLHESFVLPAGAEEEIPVHLALPFETPITVGRTRVWVKTCLDISSAVDPTDTDYINVVPDQYAGALFGVLEDLGFVLADAECEQVRHRVTAMPFVQEFEFKPRGGPYYRRVEELEVVIIPNEHGVEVMMEIDRRARGFSGYLSEMMDANEMRVRFSISDHDLDTLHDQVARTIDQYT